MHQRNIFCISVIDITFVNKYVKNITMSSLELTELFISLAKIDGISHNEKAVAEFIIKYLTGLGFEPYLDKSEKKTKSNTGNVICKINGGGDVLFLSHMDTARSTAGLKVIRQNGKLTSDGKTVLGVDNRVGNTILLATANYLSKNKSIKKGITLAFTTCEETTLAGSKNLELNDDINRVFVFDSYMRPGNFIRSSLGAATFKIEIQGKASHAGISPEKGINAIKVASNAICKSKTGRINDKTTVNFGIIRGGTGVNVVPENVYLEGEVRSATKEKVEEQLKLIEKTFNEFGKDYGAEIYFDYDWDFMPFFIDEKEKVYRDIVNAIEKSGLTPTAVDSNGGSDANSMNERGIPAVNIGIGAQNPHSNEEFIYLEDLENDFQIAKNLVHLDD